MKLIVMGAPGAGKGTQAEIVSEKYKIPAISTGAIIREAIEEGSEFGRMAKSYIDKGALLPDEAIIDLVVDRLKSDDCKNGFILDGFPRTIAQAKAMAENGIEVDAVLSLDVEDDVIVRRLSGRRECSHCRAPYHIDNNPPEKEGVCDKCGSPLIAREDDNAKTVLSRLEVYHEKTAPLKEYFEGIGKLVSVKGENGIEETSKNVIAVLENL